MKKRENRKKNIFLSGLGMIMIAGALALATPAEDGAAEEGRTTIRKGITLDQTDISGMTIEEVNKIIGDKTVTYGQRPVKLLAGDKSVTVKAADLGIKPAESDLAQRALHFGEDGNLLYRFQAKQRLEKGSGQNFDIRFVVDHDVVKNLLSERESELVTGAVDGSLTRVNDQFVYMAGQEGQKLSLESSADLIANYIYEKWDGATADITLKTQTEKPRGTKEELSSIKDLLGSYNTSFATSTAARSQNVKNGAGKVNGTILYPGESFSVAKTLNPMTAENGYAKAPSYENGKTAETYGGGICQVSTTLYNAVIRAELEVVERSAHSMVVHYVDPSMDAAIAGTSKDFQFKNNQKYPVFLEGYTDGGIIYFNVYGKETRDPNRKVDFESEVLSQTNPKTIYTATGAAGIGSISRTSGSAHTGYRARLWKIVTIDGKEKSREVFNNSSYRSTDNVFAVGTASTSPEASAIVGAAVGSQDLATIQAAIAQAQAVAAQQAADQAAADQAAAEANQGEAAGEAAPAAQAQDASATGTADAATSQPAEQQAVDQAVDQAGAH